jgi:hypothetical protein
MPHYRHACQRAVKVGHEPDPAAVPDVTSACRERLVMVDESCGARLLDRGLFDRRDLAVLATGIIAA